MIASADIRAILLFAAGRGSRGIQDNNSVCFANAAIGLYYGHMPTDESDPCDCCAIYDMGGGEQNPKFALDELHLHFLSRTVKYADGMQNLMAMKTLLEGHIPIVVGRNPTDDINTADPQPAVWFKEPEFVDASPQDLDIMNVQYNFDNPTESENNPPHFVDINDISEYRRYIGFWVSSPPSFVPRDENNRPLFSMHMRIAREPIGARSGNRTTIGSKYPMAT